MTKRELKIESPCHMQWAELKGAGAKRFCDECALHVLDGSAMTKSAAEDLVQSSDSRVCMRVAVDKNGQAIHQPETPAESPAGSSGKLAGVGLVLASAMLVACGSEPVEGDASTIDPPDSSQSTPPDGEAPHEVLMGIAYVGEDLPEMMGEAVCIEPEDIIEVGQATGGDLDASVDTAEPLREENTAKPLRQKDTAEPLREKVGRMMRVDPSDAPH